MQAKEYIASNQFLNATESLVAYYDATVMRSSREAAILTSERFIYYRDGETIALKLRDIKIIGHHIDKFNGDAIKIWVDSKNNFEFWIPEFRNAKSFHKQIMQAWKKAKK